MQGSASFAHDGVLLFIKSYYHVYHIKNNSVQARQLHNSPAVLLRRGLQVVDLPQLCSNVSVRLLPGQLVLVVVPRTLVAPLPLDFQHV